MLMKLKKVFNALIFRSWIRKQLEKQQQVVLCTECLYLTGREGKGLCMSVNPRTYYLRVVQPLQMRWAWPESFLLTSAVTAFPCAGKERIKTQEVVWAIYFCQRVWQCEEAVREGGNRKMAASMSLLHSSFCGVSSLLLAELTWLSLACGQEQADALITACFARELVSGWIKAYMEPEGPC